VPSVFAFIQVGRKRMAFLGTHPLPPANRDYAHHRNNQLEQIPASLEHIRDPVLLMGDLNTTPWSYVFKDLLRRTGLHNSLIGRGIQPSWPAPYPPLLIPLDHVLTSRDIIIHNRFTGPATGSDHYPVIVDFSISSP